MTKKIILAAFVAAFAFTSCHKDPVPTPTPEPQTITRLASEKMVKTMGMMTMNTTRAFTWENGILMHEDDTIVTPVVTTFYNNKMDYENGNLVKVTEESGKWQYTYTYENGRLKTFLNIMENDSTAWGEVTAYTEDGYVKEIMAYNDFKTTRWSLIWVDGDATEIKEEILEPEESIATNVYTFTYDNKTNAYNGLPLAFAMPDGSGLMVARYMSKHNRIEEGYTYNYNEDGFLTSVVTENDSTFYNYIEQEVE